MKKIRQMPHTPWFQPDYERADRPAELVTDFSRRHLLRIWQGIPTIERTENGTLFAAWYSGGNTEGMDNFVVLARKRPGEAWETPFMVVEACEGVRCYDECLWIDPQGRLHLFWGQAYMFFDGREGVWETVCDCPEAENPVFSAPRRLSDGVMLNKPTVLRNGRWIYTIALCRMKPFHKVGVFTVLGDDPNEENRKAWLFASDDQGKTLQRLGGVKFEGSDFFEHMFYERRDGSFRMFARNRGELLEAVSSDGGMIWSEKTESGITDPCSRFFVRRLPSGRLVMIKNDHPEMRCNMTVFLSEDDGNTWPYRLMLDERDMVSYPDAAIAPDGRLYIIYDRDRYNELEILMASVTEEEIMAGKLSSPESFMQRIVDKPQMY